MMKLWLTPQCCFWENTCFQVKLCCKQLSNSQQSSSQSSMHLPLWMLNLCWTFCSPNLAGALLSFAYCSYMHTAVCENNFCDALMFRRLYHRSWVSKKQPGPIRLQLVSRWLDGGAPSPHSHPPSALATLSAFCCIGGTAASPSRRFALDAQLTDSPGQRANCKISHILPLLGDILFSFWLADICWLVLGTWRRYV